MSDGFLRVNGSGGVQRATLIGGMLLVALSFALYVLNNQRAASFVGLVAVWLLLYGGNFELDERQRQWIFPIFAIALCIFFLVIVFWIQSNFDSFMRRHSTTMNWLSSTLNIPLPKDFNDLLHYLNMLLMLLMAVFKLSISGGLRTIRIFFRHDAGMLNSITKYGVYDFFPIRGWRLNSKWVYIHYFCCLMTLFSALALVAFLLVLNELWSLTWFPILPACSLIIFGEIAAYLGGSSKEIGQFEFDGAEVDITPFANYEQVWKSMRQVWPESWLAASNRDMWGDKK